MPRPLNFSKLPMPNIKTWSDNSPLERRVFLMFTIGWRISTIMLIQTGLKEESPSQRSLWLLLSITQLPKLSVCWVLERRPWLRFQWMKIPGSTWLLSGSTFRIVWISIFPFWQSLVLSEAQKKAQLITLIRLQPWEINSVRKVFTSISILMEPMVATLFQWSIKERLCRWIHILPTLLPSLIPSISLTVSPSILVKLDMFPMHAEELSIATTGSETILASVLHTSIQELNPTWLSTVLKDPSLVLLLLVFIFLFKSFLWSGLATENCLKEPCWTPKFSQLVCIWFLKLTWCTNMRRMAQNKSCNKISNVWSSLDFTARNSTSQSWEPKRWRQSKPSQQLILFQWMKSSLRKISKSIIITWVPIWIFLAMVSTTRIVTDLAIPVSKSIPSLI